MNTNKQRLILQYLMSSPDTYALCRSIVKSEYFSPELRRSVDFVHSFYDKYNALPAPEILEAETDIRVKTQPVTRAEVKYCTEEIEAFCKQRAFQTAILAAPPLITAGDFAAVETMVKDALLISLNKNLGVDYFDNPNARLEDLLATPPRTTTKWTAFDDAIGGGLARTELLLVTANSGGGKSITLANIAVNFLSQGMNVLYLSLELSESMIAQRFDTMFTGVPSVVWRENYQAIGTSLREIAPHMGNLVIKHMPTGTNSNAIRSYLKEFELTYGYVPDLLVVDYLDLMGANEKVSADNVWEKDKRAAEQLRDILFDYMMFGATASQQNRAALEADELHQGHIAGGISKVNTVDIHASIILTPTMKAAGEIMFKFLKTRSSDGVGKTITLRWDNRALRISNPLKDEKIDEDGVILDKVGNHNKARKSLLELMNT
jgi:KaiC/GvpD/RAD55 family RecA-like ATPase